MSETLTIATANTKFGEMVRADDGFGPFNERGVDVLLLQETHPDRDDLESNLRNGSDLRLAKAAGELGLAIAVHKDMAFDYGEEGIVLERNAVTRTIVDRFGSRATAAFRLRGRGVLNLVFEHEGQRMMVGTTHPPVPLAEPIRADMVRILPYIYKDVDMPVVVGGDMNHFRRRRPADINSWTEHGFQWVDIGDEPTYVAQGGESPLLPRLSFLDAQLDAQWHTPDLEVVHAEVATVESDHDAILAEYARVA